MCQTKIKLEINHIVDSDRLVLQFFKNMSKARTHIDKFQWHTTKDTIQAFLVPTKLLVKHLVPKSISRIN